MSTELVLWLALMVSLACGWMENRLRREYKKYSDDLRSYLDETREECRLLWRTNAELKRKLRERRDDADWWKGEG